MSIAARFAGLCLLTGVLGCDSGPPRFDVTGQLTLDGQPVKIGNLVFTPDKTAGNQGPQGVAKVESGEIVSDDKRRVIGGPHWVQVMGFDGIPYEDGEGKVAHGRPLFPLLQAPVELPMQDTSLAIKVTTTGAEHDVKIDVVNN